jgi:spore coat protein CotF
VNGLTFIKAQGSGTSDYIRFFAGSNPTLTPNLMINGTGATQGFVGINTSTPSERLHVSGNTLIDGSLTATTANTSTLVINTTPTTDPTNNNVLVRDVSTGVVKQRDITSTLNKNYASFYDTGDQTGLANTVLTMSANTSDSWNTGITLSANTRFVIQNPGVYNLAFSAQMVKIGGNSSTHAHIWLYQNGLDVLYSASQIGFPSNTVYVVPAWNFFFSTTTPNEYVELKWEINSNVDNQLLIKHQPAAGSVPAIPSVIVTINQVN